MNYFLYYFFEKYEKYTKKCTRRIIQDFAIIDEKSYQFAGIFSIFSIIEAGRRGYFLLLQQSKSAHSLLSSTWKKEKGEWLKQSHLKAGGCFPASVA